ncbi:MAG TPA: hypothetical protein PKJ99_08200 [Thermoanaerobaculales bacterium]|nr:hypothetical protein [Thermoanaerobaculales bacterium]HQL28591.1 hypothetical protein [Thermoanaerobaculales bacterium]
MTMQRLAVALSAVNLLLLSLLLGGGPAVDPATASSPPQGSESATKEAAPIPRGRALKIVDEQGRIRSRLKVEEDGTVVLRLVGRDGAIRVKLGADDGGSGLVLLDESTEPGAHLSARRSGTPAMPTTTSLTPRGRGGRERVIRP